MLPKRRQGAINLTTYDRVSGWQRRVAEDEMKAQRALLQIALHERQRAAGLGFGGHQRAVEAPAAAHDP
jgi:hypothetical protein